MSRGTARPGVVLCSCGGTLYDAETARRLAAAVGASVAGANTAGTGAARPVLLTHARACAAAALEALGAELARQGADRVLFAGCSLLERPDLAEGLARAAGLTPSAVRGVNLREPVFRRLAGAEAVRQGAAAVGCALRALALQPVFEMRRIPLHPAVLVIGEGPAAEEAARQARALGHETRQVPAVAALEGQVGAFTARLPRRRLPDGAGGAGGTVTAGRCHRHRPGRWR